METTYFYSSTTLVSMDVFGEVLNFTYDAEGKPFSMSYDGGLYYYIINLQGDVVGLYDESGELVVAYTYDAWGDPYASGTLANTVGFMNPFRFKCYVYDEDMFLYYLQSRYYDPQTGRFISADAYLVAGDHINSTNMFAYCLNNPVMYWDPEGYESISFFDMSPLQIGKFLILIYNLIFGKFNDYSKQEPEIDITDRLNDAMITHSYELLLYYEENGYFNAVIFFCDKVKTGGDWDLKLNPDWNLNSNTTYLYNGEKLRYDDVGNIHYGYVGKVLFSEEILLMGAGIYQAHTDYKKQGELNWTIDSNFDDPRDQWAISYGYHLWDRGLVV